MTQLAISSDFVSSTACFSPDGTYRYRLERVWNPAGSRVCFVMLNPSTADANFDDPTVRRCINFARAWGYGSISVVNLFALRATDPRRLADVRDPIGPENYLAISDAIYRSSEVIVAWGAHEHPMLAQRVRYVVEMVRHRSDPLMCLGTTRSGAPRHPLYVPTAQDRSVWLPVVPVRRESR